MMTRFSVHVLIVFVALHSLACSQPPTTDSGTGGDSAVAGDGADIAIGVDIVCAAGQSVCRGACLDTQSDSVNCGSCGNICPANVGCVGGRCACNRPSLVCNGACLDVTTDGANCGMCGRACDVGQVCLRGTCVEDCPAPRTFCTRTDPITCADLQSDRMNCGGCGVVCREGWGCNAGRCTCASNRMQCSGVCADTTSNAMNCGSCGWSCGTGGTCTDSRCTCGPGFTNCNGACPDLMTDFGNCGACLRPCQMGQTCMGGACICMTGRLNCGGRCTDPMTDAANCGACANSCGPMGACAAGICTCATGFTMCGTACSNTMFDRNNCGACGTVCPAAQSCIGGTCVAEPTFRATMLGTTGCMVVDHNTVTGDDHGGIATSATSVFYSGDTATGRMNLSDLGGMASAGGPHNGMFSDSSSGTVYTLLNATGAQQTTFPSVPFVATQLGVLDPMTGMLTATRVPLSAPITFGTSNAGVFGGFGRAIFHTGGATGQWFHVRLPSAAVTPLRMSAAPTHTTCETWAYWGFAEYFGGEHYVVYVESSTRIVRYRVSDGMITTLGTFTALSDMCSITFSPGNNRWYFHHEGSSQFGGTSETLGYCPATFDSP